MKLLWSGQFDKFEGYGYFSMAMMEAMQELGNDITPIRLEAIKSWPMKYFRMAGVDVNRPLVLVHPPDMRFVNAMPGRVQCFTMYEATAIPAGWASNLNNFCNTVILPSKFCADVFAEQGVKIPIHIVPGGIDPNLPVYREVVDRPYTFLALADRGDRKGYDLVWKAFWDVFGKSKDVRLVLKLRECNNDIQSNALESISDSRISIWKKDVESPAELFGAVDCFVFPSRGEGYGLPPRESAACGIPTICTNHTGMANDEIEKWALPIDAKYVRSHLPAGGLWSKPDYEQLKEKMLWVYNNREAAKEFALSAAAWMRQNRTWKHAAEKLQGVLNGTIGNTDN